MIVTELSKGIKLYILVGGRGTRLKTITGDTPKPLVPIYGKSFLQRVIDNLSGFDITLVCSDLNHEWFEDFDCDIFNEGYPSGTGGWLRKVNLPESFYVMNGDTFFADDLNVDADSTTIFVSKERISGDEGYIEGDGGKVKQFVEKNPKVVGKKKLVNTGIYKIYKKDLDLSNNFPISMEYDILPNVDLSYKVVKTKKFDIGTPERLETFKSWFNT
mgnify:CR=1 FL=1|tara:strand:+ start:10294 stop:10941 length:648 start_codon:yes stop_codon:yes gene_type:complete